MNPLLNDSNLTTRERQVIEYRFGLGGEGLKNLDETGQKFHITRERARQIEAKALKKIDVPELDIEPLRRYAEMTDLRSLLQFCYTIVSRHDWWKSRLDK